MRGKRFQIRLGPASFRFDTGSSGAWFGAESGQLYHNSNAVNRSLADLLGSLPSSLPDRNESVKLEPRRLWLLPVWLYIRGGTFYFSVTSQFGTCRATLIMSPYGL